MSILRASATPEEMMFYCSPRDDSLIFSTSLDLNAQLHIHAPLVTPRDVFPAFYIPRVSRLINDVIHLAISSHRRVFPSSIFFFFVRVRVNKVEFGGDALFPRKRQMVHISGYASRQAHIHTRTYTCTHTVRHRHTRTQTHTHTYPDTYT